MRHAKAGRRLGRTTSHRVAMFRNMVTSLLQHEKITTTDAKAKELRSIAEKMITLGKRGDLHAIRLASAYIRDKKVVTKLFSAIAPRYKERDGGYTRIIKLGQRSGDNALLSQIELVEELVEKKPTKKIAVKKAPVKVDPAVTTAAQPVAEQPAETATVDVQESSAAVADVPVTTVSETAETCEAKAD
ncbi:MAG: 50S ribosomal protein L17 [Geobacter sp.]|nr:50S ribosomal protein L17 [Geobacter sp.]